MPALSKAHMYDEVAAFKHVEGMLWADGPVYPHCGKIYELTGVRSKPSKKSPEGVERHGLKKCAECRKQFTVRIGTIFEESHIPMHKWLQVIHLMVSSKKGASSHQLHRVLEITYKSMVHVPPYPWLCVPMVPLCSAPVVVLGKLTKLSSAIGTRKPKVRAATLTRTSCRAS